MITLKTDIIIFGGINENNQKFNELYNFDFQDKKWTILFPSGEYPPSRTYHNMIYHNNKIFVFGGYSNAVLNDCYALNLTQKYLKLEDEKEIRNNLFVENLNDKINTDSNIINKTKKTIFLNFDNKNEDIDLIENSIDKGLGIIDRESYKLKENLVFFEYKEEIKLLKNQVNELKLRMENETNKNSCKVNIFLYILIILIKFNII